MPRPWLALPSRVSATQRSGLGREVSPERTGLQRRATARGGEVGDQLMIIAEPVAGEIQLRLWGSGHAARVMVPRAPRACAALAAE